MHSLDFTVDVQLDLVRKRLGSMKRKQIPFATALALTQTAADGQKAVRRTLPQRYTIRSKWLSSGIKTKKATKKRLESRVFSRDAFMFDQEHGAVRKPKGRVFSLPRKIRARPTSKIPVTKRPKAMLAKPGVFIGRTRRNQPAIYQKVGKRGKLKLLYLLHPNPVTIKPRLGLSDTVARVVRKNWKKNFGAAFARAIRTAR